MLDRVPLLLLLLTVGLTAPSRADPSRTTESLRASLPDGLGSDPRLDSAAVDLAEQILVHRVLQEEGRGFTAARKALWDRGVIDAHVTWVAVRSNGPLSADTVWAAVDEQRAGYDHAGIGVASVEGGSACAVVLLTRRDVFRVDPLPWEANAGEVFRFSLRVGLERPRVEWIHPDGEVSEVALSALSGGGYEARMGSPAGPGVHRLEVRAVSGGQEVFAAIAAAEVAPGREVSDPADEYLLRMLGLERDRYDLPPLAVSLPLAEVAAEHSRQLRDGAAFGHRSPLEPQERIAAAGIPFSVALENVARAESLDWIHTLFMSSAGHRANVLHPRVTHAGIGVARSEPLAWYATVDLVRLLPPLDLDVAQARARRAVERVRAEGAPLTSKRILDSIADQWCERIGRWGDLSDDQVLELTREVEFHLSDTERVVADLAIVEDVDEVSWFVDLLDPRFDQYGLGIYQQAGGGMVHVLIVLVDRKTQ